MKLKVIMTTAEKLNNIKEQLPKQCKGCSFLVITSLSRVVT